tara:strand:- start:214 stop:990 length:777 start_codon:yes stop_codon:yes gene_type:complete
LKVGLQQSIKLKTRTKNKITQRNKNKMTLTSMKELSKPCTISIPQDSPMYEAIMNCVEKGKEEDEHKIACLEADLEETTDTLLKKISDLEKENEEKKHRIKELIHYKEMWKEELKCMEAALTIVKDENEVNKKNMKLYMKENEKLKSGREQDKILVECRGKEIAKSHIDIINLTTENEKLKNQKGMYECEKRASDYLHKENMKLNEEIKKLKIDCKLKGGLLEDQGDVMAQQLQEIEYLKKELKKRANVFMANSADEL